MRAGNVPRFRPGFARVSGPARNQCLRDLSANQLTASARAKYVRYFEMRNARDATDYYLFFATNRLQGLKKMKEAMWKVDEAGQFTFSDATDPSQLVMFNAPQFEVLRRQILAEFSGREVAVEDIEEFVVAHTAFRETHFKAQVLKPLEALNPPGLTVSRLRLWSICLDRRRRRRTQCQGSRHGSGWEATRLSTGEGLDASPPYADRAARSSS